MSIELSTLRPDLIQKNINDYSFTKEIINNINNIDFKNGTYEALSGTNDTEYSFLWTALSSITEDNSLISTLIHNNFSHEFENDILNYIDNVSNVDTCKIVALQSMVQQLGINYTILDKIKIIPIHILKILDILSIKKEYLLRSEKVNKIFSNLLFEQTSSNIDVDSNISNTVSSLIVSRISSEISSESESSVSNITLYPLSSELDKISVDYKFYLDDNKLREYTLSTYYKILSSFCYLKYNNEDEDEIFKQLSSIILFSNFNLENPAATNIDNSDEIDIVDEANKLKEYRLKYNISKSFNESDELDKIEHGITTFEDYSAHEQYLLTNEIEYRSKPRQSNKLESKYYYYKERIVRDYFTFIENEYTDYIKLYLNTSRYNIDNNYIIVKHDKKVSLLDENTLQLNDKLIEYTAQTLTEITEAIRAIREQLKTQSQKNFIKGTKNHIVYLVTEYIKNNIYPVYKRLAKTINNEYNTNLCGYDYSISDIIVNVNEYVDPTEYFNISTNVDVLSDNVNTRYWENKDSIYAIAPFNSNNIFKKPNTVNSSVKQTFSQDNVESFYRQNMQMKFNVLGELSDLLSNELSNKTLLELSDYYHTHQNKHLSQFLNYLYNSAADTTYYDISGNICCDTYSGINTLQQDEYRQYKEALFKKYSGSKSGEYVIYNLKNKRHPSYQIHPYIKNFNKYEELKYTIDNIVNITDEELSTILINNISAYIDEYIDVSGYIINAWKNPLNTNSDYLTEYEKSSHKTPLNNISAQIDYDGLFYPAAVNDFLNAPATFINSLSSSEISCDNIWYRDLILSYKERCRIAKQLHELSSYINKVAKLSNYDIYRYGKDFYGNAYILLKDYNLSNRSDLISMTPDERKKDNEGNDIPGVIWMRIKNHPIAFPLMIYNEISVDEELTQVEYFSEKQILIADEKIENIKKYKIKNNLSCLMHYDFTISKDKTKLLFYTTILDDVNEDHKYLVHVNVKKDVYTDINLIQQYKHYFILNNYNKLLSTYNFIKFYNFDYHLGAILLNTSNVNNNKLTCNINLPYYHNYQLNKIKDNLSLSCVINNCANDAKTDLRIDVNDKKRLTIAYRTKELNNLSVEDYLGIKLKYTNYNSPTLNKLSVFTNSIKTLDYRFDDKQFFPIECERTYIPYNDLGFIPLYEYKNEDNQLCQDNPKHINKIFSEEYGYNNGYYYEGLSGRGQLKFNLVGRADLNGIFFKNTRPVRAFEHFKHTGGVNHLSNMNNTYLSNFDKYKNAISAANIFDIHYLEIPNIKQVSNENAIYDPNEFQRNTTRYNDLSVRIDESFYNIIQPIGAGFNITDNIRDYINRFNDVPYFWYTDGSISNFMELYCPGTGLTSQELCADCSNTFVIQIPTTKYNSNLLNDLSIDLISVNYILPNENGNNKYGKGIKLDFNSAYYNLNPDILLENEQTRGLSYDGKVNYFNWKHLFLNLDSPGDAGYLQIWHPVEGSGLMKNPGNTYFIKNISDTKPKFILSLIDNMIEIKQEELAPNEYYLMGNLELSDNSSSYLVTYQNFDSNYIGNLVIEQM